MANTETKPIPDNFLRWHKAIGLGDDQARLEARWAGVSTVADSVDSKDTEALIRLAFKSRQPAATSELQKIRNAFKTADTGFEMQGNDREMQILAGAVLETLMNRGETSGAEAALGIATAALGGARKPNLPIDLRVLAEVAIDRISDANRARPKLDEHMSTDAPNFDFEKAAAKVREQQNWEGVIAAFGLATEGARNGFIIMARRQANAMRAIDSFIKAQDEELQMLWWVTGQRSADFDCAFNAVPADAQVLVFAKELADHTEFLPGPASIKGLLSRAGLNDRKKMSIPRAINAADPEWLRGLVSDDEPSPVTTPIHYAIKRKLETGENEAWVAGWTAAAGLAPALTLSPLALGVLFYRERLLLLFAAE